MIAASIDLESTTSPNLRIFFYCLYDQRNYVEQTLTFPPSGWQFDSSTLISFCADTSGDPGYHCSINEFKYWLGNPTDFYGYIRNVNRNLL